VPTISTHQICKSAGVTRGQLRVYEREGLLNEPQRTQAGYRLYDDDAIARLKAIRQLKELGFSLAEIAELLSERDRGDIDLALLQQRAGVFVREVDDRIARLAVVRDYVAAVALGDFSAIDDPDCSFLVHFLSATAATTATIKSD
jgi:MerR family transcriptional regulator, copper efflux regulator